MGLANKPKRKPTKEPTLDEYMRAATRLAKLVRQAFDNPGSVKRPQLLRAVKDFERVDFRSYG